MNRPIALTHGIWAAVATSAFFLGAHFLGDEGAGGPGSPGSGSGATARSSAAGTLGSATGTGNGTISESLAATRGGAGESGLGSNRPLTTADIEALGEEFRASASPVDRRLAFSKLLSALTPENALEIRAQIEHLPAQSAEFREFHYAWGAVAGEDAVSFGAETPEDDMTPALAGWAGEDPAAALSWFESLDIANDPAFEYLRDELNAKPDELRSHLMRGLVYGLATTDPAKAAGLVLDASESGNRAADGMIHLVTEAVVRGQSPADAAAWAEALPTGTLRDRAMGHTAGNYAKRDPEAAAEWAAALGDDPGQAAAVSQVGATWVQRDPEAALDWLGDLPAGKPQQAGMGRALAEWAGRDPTAASEFLGEMPPSDARDAAVGGFSRRLAWEDPESAVAWANSIASEEQRLSTITGVGRAWARKDAHAAAEWLVTSGLPEDLQLEILSSGKRDGR